LASKKKNWHGKTGGGSFGQRALFGYFRHGSVRLAYGIMGFVIFFYLIINRNATRNIYRYFRQRQRFGRGRAVVNVYLNHYLFGKTLIDKFALFAGRKNEYSIEQTGVEWFNNAAMDKERGAILVHAHVGCSEIVGYTLSQPYKTINAVVYGGEVETMQRFRSNILSGQNVKMIPVVDGFSHIFDVNNALKNNEFVSISADRIYEGSRNHPVNFMGAVAEFPIAPFQLAARMKVPVLAYFVMQDGFKKYKCHIVEISDAESKGLPVQKQVEKFTERFAHELEKILNKYPLQWYNFHSFWK